MSWSKKREHGPERWKIASLPLVLPGYLSIRVYSAAKERNLKFTCLYGCMKCSWSEKISKICKPWPGKYLRSSVLDMNPLSQRFLERLVRLMIDNLLFMSNWLLAELSSITAEGSLGRQRLYSRLDLLVTTIRHKMLILPIMCICCFTSLPLQHYANWYYVCTFSSFWLRFEAHEI